MSRIRGKHTKSECTLRRILWARGLRYRLHAHTPHGRPDLVFVSAKVAVFVDGCFWHGCPEHYVPPRSRAAFWSTKLRQNVERDIRQTRELEAHGWRVVRCWEHEVATAPGKVADRIEATVRGKRTSRNPTARVIRVDFVSPDGSIERRQFVSLRTGESLGEEVRERRTTKWHGGSRAIAASRRPRASGRR